MEYFVISAKFVPLKYYTLSSQLQRLTSFSVGCSGRRILSPGQIAVMRKWSINQILIKVNRYQMTMFQLDVARNKPCIQKLLTEEKTDSNWLTPSSHIASGRCCI